MKTLLIIQLIVALTFTKSYSVVLQLDIWSNLKQLNLEFSVEDNNRINEINQHKEHADDLVTQATEAENSESVKRGFNELFEASRDLFDIYNKYCKSALEELNGELPSELDRALKLENRAREKLNESEILKNEAENAAQFTKTRNILTMVFDLEQLALLNKGRALRLYQDFPVIYDYKWFNDFTAMTGSPEKIIGFANNKLEEKKGSPGSMNQNKAREPLQQQPGEGVKYIVQIAAHSSEISEKELKKIYSGNREVRMMIEDNWYKYYFGPYDTFREAEKMIKSLGMDNIFLAAYLDGQRIGIGKAREIEE